MNIAVVFGRYYSCRRYCLLVQSAVCIHSTREQSRAKNSYSVLILHCSYIRNYEVRFLNVRPNV